ncbi:MAG TPA: efflux RND transporter periplasmic adaptor subunit [Thermoanaerobaculia bacterium]|nr:efflux RND transporter periplasmic adaptor subunit [Thermoanaerobaculia bacterium]
MKTKLPWILCALLAFAVVAQNARKATPVTPKRQPLYWVDPMHPSYKSDKPGKAPDCGMDLTPVYADEKTESVFTPRKQQLIGVQTGVAEKRAIGRTVRATGRVAIDETRLHTITTKFDGYIETLNVDFTGKPVRRGQPLFSIYSPDLLATQQEYLLALRAAKQSPQLLEAARQRLRLWDISDAEIRALEHNGVARKSLTIASPVTGTVLKKMAIAGARVMAGDPMFEIANLDRVWILASVYESELQFVHIGSNANVTLTYLPGRTFAGRVTFIDPTVDPMTRTVSVRIEVANTDGALKPEMFADVTMQEPTREVIAVPQSAVLMTGTRSIVYVVSAEGEIDAREVTTGTRSEQFIEIRSGIRAGEKVVTEANFLVDSESRLRTAAKP